MSGSRLGYGMEQAIREPNNMKFGDLRVSWPAICENHKDDEPCRLTFPRQVAEDAIGKQQRHPRIVINNVTKFSRDAFLARKEAWTRELGDSPELFMLALDTAMETFDLRGWRLEQEGSQTLGDA